MQLLKDDIRPKQIITRDSLRNAIAAVAASGGSTNAVLHLLAIAADAGVPLDARRFRRNFCERPLILADLKPGGRFNGSRHVRRRRYAPAGAASAEAGLLARRTSPHRDERSSRKSRDANETAGQEVVRPLANPIKSDGGLRDPSRFDSHPKDA